MRAKKHVKKFELTIDQWKDAIEKAGGVIEGIAKVLNMDRRTVWRHYKANPEISELIAEQQQVCLDLALMQVRQKIEEGDSKIVMWYLDRKGKDLGFGRSLDVSASVNMQAQIVLYMPNDGREKTEVIVDSESEKRITSS